MKSIASSAEKIGQMIINSKQILWRKDFVYACIPFKQLFQGHVLITTKRKISNFKQLEVSESADLILAVQFVAKCLEQLYNCNSSTVHIQNSGNNDIKQFFVHVIPRKKSDIPVNDEIYALLDSFPSQIIKQYNQKFLSGSPQLEKYLDHIQPQKTKIQQYLNKRFLQHSAI